MAKDLYQAIYSCYHSIKTLAPSINGIIAHWDADGIASSVIALKLLGLNKSRVRAYTPKVGPYTIASIKSDIMLSVNGIIALDYALGSTYDYLYYKLSGPLVVIDHHTHYLTRPLPYEARDERLDMVYCNIQLVYGDMLPINISTSLTMAMIAQQELDEDVLGWALVGFNADYGYTMSWSNVLKALKLLLKGSEALLNKIGEEYEYISKLSDALNTLYIDYDNLCLNFDHIVKKLASRSFYDALFSIEPEARRIKFKVERELSNVYDSVEEHANYIIVRHYKSNSLIASKASRLLSLKYRHRIVIMNMWYYPHKVGFIYVRNIDDKLLGRVKNIIASLLANLDDEVSVGGRSNVLVIEYTREETGIKLVNEIEKIVNLSTTTYV